MGKPYSIDLRPPAPGRGCSGRRVSVRPGKQGRPKGSVLDPHADFIFDTLKARNAIENSAAA